MRTVRFTAVTARVGAWARNLVRRPIPWRTLPWGKIIAVLFGLPAGVFGLVFAVIVGHLVDELLWAYVMRRLLRSFIGVGRRPPELEDLAVPTSILVLLTRVASCSDIGNSAERGEPSRQDSGDSGGAAGAGIGSGTGIGRVYMYLYDRHASGRRARRTLELAAEEASRVSADDDALLSVLDSRLQYHERAEVAWLGGRIAREGGPCARWAAEEIAERLKVDNTIVADAMRPAGGLDERSCMLLGVPQDADRELVRHAYRRLAAEFHPDATGALEAHQQKQAGEAFLRIRAAYERLMRELGEGP